MRAIRVGILKCIDSIRWAIPTLIDRVLPYQFLVNQLADCSTKDGQFQCPTCRDAIQERLSDGRVTVHGVEHRIAKHEASRDWRVTYPEMYKAVKQDLLTSINLQVAICARINGLDGRYHMELRKGKELGLKLANKVARVILPAALVVGTLTVVVLVVEDAMATNAKKDAAMKLNTTVIPTWVDSLHLDYTGKWSPGIEHAHMCGKCKETVGSHAFPAHGHKLIATSNGEFVRSCPLD